LMLKSTMALSLLICCVAGSTCASTQPTLHAYHLPDTATAEPVNALLAELNLLL